ncbi:hypothetical protein JKF63_07067 [Porcisia hertigi]|uniref:Uncharacterized protein n=1 Tax=Porcisia hertigi TaxID=2761500 RepID=A0A836LHE3_9TRYP|nr:hypothetical protein JKF63_07067 [Porcisia hertigi]
MSGASSALLTEAEVREMSSSEIQVNLERCSRLVTQTALLQRLHDGGEGIRHRHKLFTEELERRRTVEAANTDGKVSFVSSTSTEPRKQDNEAAFLAESAHEYADVAREVAHKYKDHRVNVEETVRRMYEGAISESEIQRILKSVPPHFFLTYAETCEMEQRSAREARKAELQKLAALAARHSPMP